MTPTRRPSTRPSSSKSKTCLTARRGWHNAACGGSGLVCTSPCGAYRAVERRSAASSSRAPCPTRTARCTSDTSGIHPDRHLGALPAAARATVHLRLRQRRARHADHARGAQEGIAPERSSRASAPSTSATSPASASASTTSRPRTRRRTGDCTAVIYGALAAAATSAASHRQAYDERSADVPAGPLRARHLPRLQVAGPVRRLLRGLRHHLFAARSDRRRVGASRHGADRARDRSTCSSSSATSSELLHAWTAPGTSIAGAASKLDEWFSARAARTGTSRATRPISASRSRASRASTSTSGWTRRSATWRAS